MWGGGTGKRPTFLADSSAQQEARCRSGAQAGSVGGKGQGVCAGWQPGPRPFSDGHGGWEPGHTVNMAPAMVSTRGWQRPPS